MVHMDPGGCLYDGSESELDFSNTVIYCDMDGVLADFVTGAIDLCSSILDGPESKKVKGITGLPNYHIVKILKTKFYKFFEIWSVNTVECHFFPGTGW